MIKYAVNYNDCSFSCIWDVLIYLRENDIQWSPNPEKLDISFEEEQDLVVFKLRFNI